MQQDFMLSVYFIIMCQNDTKVGSEHQDIKMLLSVVTDVLKKPAVGPPGDKSLTKVSSRVRETVPKSVHHSLQFIFSNNC